jgi:uncharacterized protein (DUF3084 family)
VLPSHVQRHHASNGAARASGCLKVSDARYIRHFKDIGVQYILTATIKHMNTRCVDHIMPTAALLKKRVDGSVAATRNKARNKRMPIPFVYDDASAILCHVFS